MTADEQAGGLRLPLVMGVPDFGRRVLDIGRDASYVAAEGGAIVTVRVGRSLRVPTPAALKHIGWPDDLIAQVLGIDPERTEAEPATGSATATVHPLAPARSGDHHDAPPAA